MPQPTLMSDEDLLISPEMVDTDQDKEPFLADASITEGCSGHKKIDTLYENTSVDIIDNPREGSTPAPVCLNGPMYPNRSL
jgi:hypothetical protein